MINHWIRRVLIELKRSGAQLFIMEFHENLEYEECYKFFKKCKKCNLGNYYLK